jgi:aminopeptidase N
VAAPEAKGKRTLVGSGGASLVVDGCDPVILNSGQDGYYRTLYSPAQLAGIAGTLATVPAIDQLGVVTDAWQLFSVGLEPADGFLALVQALPASAKPAVWHQVAGALVEIDQVYGDDTAARAAFRRFSIDRLRPVFDSIGWRIQPEEPLPVGLARDSLIRSLSALGYQPVIDEARRRYAAQKSDPSAVPPELRKTILAVVARHADVATWAQLHAAAEHEATPLMRDYLYDLLASTDDTALASRALELSLMAEPGRSNSLKMIRSVSKLHPELALDFSLAHLPQVMSMAKGPPETTFIARLAENATTMETAKKLVAYSREHLPAGSRRAAEFAMENIAYRSRVREQRLPLITQRRLAGQTP